VQPHLVVERRSSSTAIQQRPMKLPSIQRATASSCAELPRRSGETSTRQSARAGGSMSLSRSR
jgi:hypothetical protein